MPLASGTRLGPYEIVTAIGAGGMGEVYRARDTRLDRTVAIKVLPESLAGDPQFRERFEREAKTISQLNHPHICTLHDLGRADGVDYLVMEFVEGETLEHRLRVGAISLREALPIAQQIAGALEAAHERGIVHRDLKPANIKVMPDGSVKVLDFGLAKSAIVASGGSQLSMSPTVFAGATQAGVILGTAAYMSPEQARGLPVDKRADIWAFGCVLYEMLTGRQTFSGATATDIIAAIVREEPAWDALPPDAPPAIHRVLRRCLQKDQRRRLRDIADVLPDLDEAAHPPAAAPGERITTAPVNRRSILASLAVAAAFIVSAFLIGAWWRARQLPAVGEWIGERLGGSVVAFDPRLSPDGQTLAFQAMVDGQTQVAVMKPQSGNWTVLTHSRGRGLVADLCWSRDGTRIFFDRYFDVPQGIFSVPALGGDERLELDNAESPQALPDGSLLVTRINAARVPQLHRFWLETGRLDPLPALIARFTRVPAVRVFPDAREAVFFGRPSEASESPDALYAIDLASRRIRQLAPSAVFDNAIWGLPLAVTPDGHWVRFGRQVGSLYGIVEVARTGSDTLRPLVTVTSKPLYMDIGIDGTFYVDQVMEPPELLSWSPASGLIERLDLPEIYDGLLGMIPLPDGRVLMPTQPAGGDQLMVMAAGKAAEPFVDTREPTTFPAAPVGPNRVAFLVGAASNRKVAIASIADGRIQRRLSRVDGNAIAALAASPDGRTLFYSASGIVWAVPTDESAEPRKIHDGDSMAVDPRGEYVVVKMKTTEQNGLVRVSLSGGKDQPIPIAGDLRLTQAVISPGAIAPDGRIAVRVGSKDSWYWPAAVLDPRTGAVTAISKSIDLDMQWPGWAADGRLVTLGFPTRSTIWRFRPQARP